MAVSIIIMAVSLIITWLYIQKNENVNYIEEKRLAPASTGKRIFQGV
jgi:lipopolysaccharide export system protein LptC